MLPVTGLYVHCCSYEEIVRIYFWRDIDGKTYDRAFDVFVNLGQISERVTAGNGSGARRSWGDINKQDLYKL